MGKCFEEVLVQIDPMIKSYAHTCAKRIGTDLYEDLLQEGRLAAYKVWKDYKPFPGCKFSTFVSFSIKGAMKRYVFRNISCIKIPDSYHNKKFWEKKRNLTKEESRIKNISVNISLETPISSDEDTLLKDVLTEEVNFWETVEKEDQKEILLKKIKDRLSSDEYFVIRKRFFENGNTFEQIGKEMNVSKQRAQQLEKHAINKLRYKQFEKYFH